MQLRSYQQDAVAAALADIKQGKNPVLQLATGTGKSLIIAEIAHHTAETGGHALMLTHVTQLVQQNAATYERYTGSAPAIVCSSLGKSEPDGRVIYATVQSLVGVLERMVPPSVIIIDEAHRVPHNDSETASQYAAVLNAFPSARRVALSATPWRTDNGRIHGEGDEFWFNSLAYQYTVPQAVKEGWLSPLVGVETEVQLDIEEVSVAGDFVSTEVERQMKTAWLRAVAQSLPQVAGTRKHIAVYCPTVKAAENAAQAIRDVTGWTTAVITGSHTQTERERIFAGLASGEIRVLCSVDTITTGFDFPALDCIVCLRPTLSSSLWVQIQGRGTRLSEGKKNCLVLDYVGNLMRLGGVGMYESHYRQRPDAEPEVLDAVEPRKPHVKKERKVYPGVKSLTVVDPMTGKAVRDGTQLTLNVHNVSGFGIKPRGRTDKVLLITYVCTTENGVRLDANLFLDVNKRGPEVEAFYKRRRIALSPVSTIGFAAAVLKGADQPKTITAIKRGKYWNVVAEQF